MKDNKLLIKMGNEDTWLNNIQRKVKDSMFYLMHILLKHPENDLWIQVLIIIIEMVQLLAFPFALIFSSVWKHEKTFQQISYFFHYFQLVGFLLDNEVIYLIAIYICVGVITLIIIWVIFASVLLANHNISSRWILSLLRIALNLLSTAFFLPILQILFSIFHCVNIEDIIRLKENIDTKLRLRQLTVNYFAPSMTCYQSVYFVHVVFAIIFILILIALVSFVLATLYDSKINSTSFTGKLNADFDKMICITKIVLVIAFCFFGTKKNDWAIIVLLCLLSIILLYTYITRNPYMNKTIHLIYCISMSLFCWSTITLLIGKILEKTTFNGCLPMFFIGIPIIIFSILIYNVKILHLLMINMTKFTKGTDALKQIRLLLSIVNNRENSRAAKIIIKGYSYQYEANCPMISCPLKKYLESLEKGNESLIFLLQHIESLFHLALSKFPICSQLRIAYCFYLLEYMNKKQKANKELLEAEKYALSFEEQFIIFRSKKIIEEQSADINENEENIDVVSTLTYRNYFIQFKQTIQKISVLYIDFWSLLLIPNEDQEHLTTLNDYGTKIISFVEDLQELFDKMQKIKSKDQELLCYYSDFLNDILNDKDKALMIKSQQNEIEEVKQIVDDTNLLNLDTNALSTSDEYQYIVVSGSSESFGNITNISLGICLILGYTHTELVGKMYEIIMPEIFQKMHRKLLISKVNDHKKEMTDVNHQNQKPHFKDVHTFARNKSRYLIPISFKATLVSSESRGLSFIAKIIPEPTPVNQTSVCYIITNNLFIIQNFTVNSVNLLGMTSYALNNSIEITTFIKQFQQEFLKMIVDHEDQTPEEKLILKRQIINKKYRTPSLIYWKIHEMFMEQRFKSSQLNESDLSPFEMPKSKSNVPDNFYMSIQDAMIAGKQEGYIFKFEVMNNSSNTLSQHTVNISTKDILNSLKGIQSLDKLKKVTSKETIIEAQIENYKYFIPEGKAGFQLDSTKMSYVQNHKSAELYKKEIRDRAYEKVNKNQTKTQETSSSEEYTDETNSDNNSPYSSSSSSDDDNEPTTNKNEQQSKRATPVNTHKTSTDDWYRVNLQNIKYSLYSFEKKVVIEVSYHKKSQIEMKLTNEEEEETDNPKVSVKKNTKENEISKEEDKKTEAIDQELLLIQQINHALSKEENQPTITKLKWIMIAISIFFFMFAVVWCILLVDAKTKFSENYLLISDSYQLQIQFLISQSYIRDLTLIAHENYTVSGDKTAIIKQVLGELKTSYLMNYNLINHITTTPLQLTQNHTKMLHENTFSIRVTQDNLSYFEFNMSLPVALIEANTAAFHIINDLTTYYPSNNNIYFYMYNVDNNISTKLEEITGMFVDEMIDLINHFRVTYYMLMAIVYALLVGTFFLFSYAYNAVAKRKESYLEVFFDIGANVIKTSLEKCERFTKKLQTTSFSEFISYDENDIETDDTAIIKQPGIKKEKHHAKHNKNSKETLIIKILYVALLIFIIIYASVTYAFYSIVLDRLAIYVIIFQSQGNAFVQYNKLYRNMRECFYDDQLIVENQVIAEYFPEFMSTFYSNIIELEHQFLSYRNYFPTNFSLSYTEMYHNNLCVILNVIPGVCNENTIKHIAEYGMTSILSLFTEEARVLKNSKYLHDHLVTGMGFKYNLTFTGLDKYYELLPKDPALHEKYYENSPIQFFNGEQYKRVKGLYEYFIKPAFLRLFATLQYDIDNYIYTNSVVNYSITYIYMFIISCTYLFIWKPFETRLKTVIFKTKNMLGIIPKEVLASLANIHKLLNINSSFNKLGVSERKAN